MYRLRLAFLALTCALLVNLAGCCSFCEEGRFRPFRSFYDGGGSGLFSRHRGECECHHMAGAPTMEAGPTFMPPAPQLLNNAAPIPITNIPNNNQPPQVFKVPQATTTPYSPTN